MIYYSPTILVKAGFFKNFSNGISLIFIATIFLYMINSIGMLIAFFIVDKAGRRGLLLLF